MTTCGQCSTELRIAFMAGKPQQTGPELLWLAEGGTDLRASFCTPTVLLCGPEHGRAWADVQGGRGELLDAAEASRRGAADWAGCADAVRVLA